MKFNDIFTPCDTATHATSATIDEFNTSNVAQVTNVTNDPDQNNGVSSVSVFTLKKLAGDEWNDINTNPDHIALYSLLVGERLQREKGIKPDNYTQASNCQGCGDVWLWESAPDAVLACPWCFNRRNHQPIPRPSLHACYECRFFIPNKFGSAGIGSCSINKNTKPCYHYKKHNCHYFIEQSIT